MLPAFFMNPHLCFSRNYTIVSNTKREISAKATMLFNLSPGLKKAGATGEW